MRRLEAGAYFGATTPIHERAGLSVARTSFVADLVIPPHEHDNAFFCFVLAGLGTRWWPARDGRQAPMALTLFPAGVPHANGWHGAGGRVLHVEFARRWLDDLQADPRVLDSPRDHRGGAPVWLARRLAAECERLDTAMPLAVEGLVLELLAACARESQPARGTRAPHWLDRVRAQLHDRFDENISLSALAAEAGVSADHLSRLFRRHHGRGIGEYVRGLRLDFACERLTQGDESIAAIAQAAGFVDQSHFTREFRRHVGATPALYRAARGKSRTRTK